MNQGQVKLKRALRSAGITQRKVAIELDITERTLCNKLNGQAEFVWAEVKAICNMLHVRNPYEIFI